MAIHICNFFLPGAHRLRQSCRVGWCPVQYGRPAGRPPPPGLYRLRGSSGTYGAASGERGRIPHLLQFRDTRGSASSTGPMIGNFFLQKKEKTIRYKKAMLCIHIGINLYRIQHFTLLGQKMEIRFFIQFQICIRIEGLMTKNCNILQLKKTTHKMLGSKIAIYFILRQWHPYNRTSKLQKPSAFEKEHPELQKKSFYIFFLWVMCFPG